MNFVRWIYGAPTAQSVLGLLEKQLAAMCKESTMRIQVYAKDPEQGQFVLLCPPKVHFLQFEAFCFSMTRIRFNVPTFWSPIEYRLADQVQLGDPGDVHREPLQQHDRSPSMMIEGKSGMQKREKRLSLMRSLSNMIRPKQIASPSHLAVEQRLLFEENDDAASVSFLEPIGNDENMNVLNRKKPAHSPKLYRHRFREDKEAEYTAKCKALKNVFVTVCGAFNEGSGSMEYYDRCEELQCRVQEGMQKRNPNGSGYPLRLAEEFDPNKICVVKKYSTGSM